MNEHNEHYQYIEKEFQPDEASYVLDLGHHLTDVFKRAVRLNKKNKTIKDEVEDVEKLNGQLEKTIKKLSYIFNRVESTYFNRFITYYDSIFNELDNDYLKELIVEFNILRNKMLLNEKITFEDKEKFIKNLQQKFTALNILHYPAYFEAKLQN